MTDDESGLDVNHTGHRSRKARPSLLSRLAGAGTLLNVRVQPCSSESDVAQHQGEGPSLCGSPQEARQFTLNRLRSAMRLSTEPRTPTEIARPIWTHFDTDGDNSAVESDASMVVAVQRARGVRREARESPVHARWQRNIRVHARMNSLTGHVPTAVPLDPYAQESDGGTDRSRSDSPTPALTGRGGVASPTAARRRDRTRAHRAETDVVRPRRLSHNAAVYNGYSDRVESAIEKVYQKALSLKWLNNEQSNLCRWYIRRVRHPAMILTNLVGTGALLNLIDKYAEYTIGEIFLAVLMVFSSAALAIEALMDWAGKEMVHKIRRNQFLELCHEIELTMSLERPERPHAQIFLSELTQKTNSFASDMPPFSSSVERRFNDMLENMGKEFDTFERPMKIQTLQSHLGEPTHSAAIPASPPPASLGNAHASSAPDSPESEIHTPQMRYSSPKAPDDRSPQVRRSSLRAPSPCAPSPRAPSPRAPSSRSRATPSRGATGSRRNEEGGNGERDSDSWHEHEHDLTDVESKHLSPMRSLSHNSPAGKRRQRRKSSVDLLTGL